MNDYINQFGIELISRSGTSQRQSAPARLPVTEDVTDDLENPDSNSDNAEGGEEDEDDEFTRLKQYRQEQRKSRLLLNLARSASNNPQDGLSEADFLLLGSATSDLYTPSTAATGEEGEFRFFSERKPSFGSSIKSQSEKEDKDKSDK